MKIILSILIFVSVCKGQINSFINKNDRAIHFYTSCALNETFYNLHGNLFKTKKVYKKFIFSNVLTFGCGLSKEIHDKNRCNKSKRTGFNKEDLYIDIWSLPCYILVKICINDFYNNKKNEQTKYKDYKYNVLL